jgi:hypothetical protein
MVAVWMRVERWCWPDPGAPPPVVPMVRGVTPWFHQLLPLHPRMRGGSGWVVVVVPGVATALMLWCPRAVVMVLALALVLVQV